LKQILNLYRLFLAGSNNLIDLSDSVTAFSCEQDIKANPVWKTLPNQGATVSYISIGEKRRGEAPKTIIGPTNTGRQEICVGIYFVWSERYDKDLKRNRITSDDTKRFSIGTNLNEVVILEDR
jgi:hypothetical protein